MAFFVLYLKFVEENSEENELWVSFACFSVNPPNEINPNVNSINGTTGIAPIS